MLLAVDVVRYDFSHANLLAEGGALSGVIDDARAVRRWLDRVWAALALAAPDLR